MGGPSRERVTLSRRLRAAAGRAKVDVLALRLAVTDPRVPWAARAVAALTAAYALSPIDLVPDFIPVLGQLDDLLLVPLGVALAVRLVPAPVMAELRAEAARRLQERPRSWVGAALVVLAWLGAVAAAWALLGR